MANWYPALPPDRVLRRLLHPGSLADILAGQRPKARIDLAALRLPPEVRITSPMGSGIATQQQIALLWRQRSRRGVAEVRLYHNGKSAASQVGKSGPTSQHESELRSSRGRIASPRAA